MCEPAGLEPLGVFGDRLVKPLGAVEADVPVMQGERPRRPFGADAPADHEIQGAGQAGPVRPRLAMDQERIPAVFEQVDEHEQFAAGRPSGGAQWGGRRNRPPTSRVTRNSSA